MKESIFLIQFFFYLTRFSIALLKEKVTRRDIWALYLLLRRKEKKRKSDPNPLLLHRDWFK